MKVIAGLGLFLLAYIIGWMSGYGKALLKKKEEDFNSMFTE
tara:strand:- start:343 stop:465 length:123 start_codon:yes stop_codon:yes gene_type:complete